MLSMDIGLPRRQPDLAEDVSSPYAVWVKDSLEVAFNQVRRHSGQAVQRQKRLYDQRAVRHLFDLGDWVMRYYPAGKKCKLDSIWTGPYLIVASLGWTVGIQRHLDEPVIFIHCQDVKKIPPPSGVQTIPPPGGTPAVPMLGASTVAHTSRDSPLVTALPPDEGVELADVDSLLNERSMSWHSESKHASMLSEGGRRSPLTGSVGPEAIPFPTTAIRMDDTCTLYPFSPHKSDAGPIRLMTIAHAFNYRMAVLRDDLTVNGRGSIHSPDAGVASTCSTGSDGHLCIEPSWEKGGLGLVPFVSYRPGAYGRLRGLLVSSDWLRPVTRGGWRAGFLDSGCGSADVS